MRAFAMRINVGRRQALSLAELMAVVVILALVAALILPRVSDHFDDAERNTCFTNKGEIELQVQLWNRNTGSFPPADLSGISSDQAYFPEGLPVCPVDGSAYTIDTNTGFVSGHTH